MPRKASPATDDAAWARAFRDALTQRERKPSGEGWLTRIQLGRKLKIGKTRLCLLLADMVRQGRAEKFSGVVAKADGKRYNQIWYRLL